MLEADASRRIEVSAASADTGSCRLLGIAVDSGNGEQKTARDEADHIEQRSHRALSFPGSQNYTRKRLRYFGPARIKFSVSQWVDASEKLHVRKMSHFCNAPRTVAC